MIAAAVIEKPQLAKQVHHFTLEEYHLLGEIPQRTELIEGVIVEKMPKSPLHIFITETLRDILTGIYGSGYYIREEKPISIQALDSEPEPDLAVISGKRGDFLHAHPTTAELVVEVAHSSLAMDRIKVRGYALAGVREYWIINVEKKCVEVFLNPQGENYATEKDIQFSDSIHIKGKEIRISDIFPPENK